MEFPYTVRGLGGEGYISRWDAQSLKKLSPEEHANLKSIVSTLGKRSAAAQGLGAPITDVYRLQGTDQRLYMYASRGPGSTTIVLGGIKMGKKKLFIRKPENAVLHELEPLCVLDFYVHESCQRQGVGRQLFEAVLAAERQCAAGLAYDRPSPKLLAFLKKHYGLADYVPQNNNFVIYNKYYDIVGSSSMQQPSSSPSSMRRRPKEVALQDTPPPLLPGYKTEPRDSNTPPYQHRRQQQQQQVNAPYVSPLQQHSSPTPHDYSSQQQQQGEYSVQPHSTWSTAAEAVNSPKFERVVPAYVGTGLRTAISIAPSEVRLSPFNSGNLQKDHHINGAPQPLSSAALPTRMLPPQSSSSKGSVSSPLKYQHPSHDNNRLMPQPQVEMPAELTALYPQNSFRGVSNNTNGSMPQAAISSSGSMPQAAISSSGSMPQAAISSSAANYQPYSSSRTTALQQQHDAAAPYSPSRTTALQQQHDAAATAATALPSRMMLQPSTSFGSRWSTSNGLGPSAVSPYTPSPEPAQPGSFITADDTSYYQASQTPISVVATSAQHHRSNSLLHDSTNTAVHHYQPYQADYHLLQPAAAASPAAASPAAARHHNHLLQAKHVQGQGGPPASRGDALDSFKAKSAASATTSSAVAHSTWQHSQQPSSTLPLPLQQQRTSNGNTSFSKLGQSSLPAPPWGVDAASQRSFPVPGSPSQHKEQQYQERDTHNLPNYMIRSSPLSANIQSHHAISARSAALAARSGAGAAECMFW
ncbi:hypothetical protein CEUSTIGMA_g8664.t1 [Chlamydomonas eustigma]|uniref:Alpha-tubulin N-acetyltransferase n=1 Tax=Chlamydomonas eustigma TaxID=1157962 RepID=A0A250XE99_9CHLO|nr:hypothetical protein CEUSTIGMA_g8664.t1 [Chlamydomonas eustigma]|eukprot:GAX81232.1 hypothetical protein CEUSTIGMA_g8664.t1 [Chlamydomonas eustigma]